MFHNYYTIYANNAFIKTTLSNKRYRTQTVFSLRTCLREIKVVQSYTNNN